MALTVATNTGALMAQAAASSVNKEMEKQGFLWRDYPRQTH